MKKIIFTLLCACSIGVQAQISVLKGSDAVKVFEKAKVLKMEEGKVFPDFIELNDNANLNEAQFFQELRVGFGIDADFNFKLKNSNADHLGYTHNRYQLTFSGIEVAYSNFNVHLKEGIVISASGNLNPVLPNSKEEELTLEQARDVALRHTAATQYMWELENNTNEIEPDFYPKGKLTYLSGFDEVGSNMTLTYVFNVYASKPMSRELIFVNAQSGLIEFQENLIHTGGDSKGTAVTGYSDTQKVITDSLPNIFRLRDSTRGIGITTLNCQGMPNYTVAIDFIDSNNFWSNFNGNLDQFAGDAHWGTEVTYDYFLNVHNRNSIDDSGFVLTSYIHYDQNYVNAFWNGRFMTYGDGNATNGSLTALDIVGHEITHGLTDFTSDLIYANESGALNESFSDIFGTAIEFAARPSRANWLVGEDIGNAFRSMSDPKANGDPDTYDGLNWVDQNCISSATNDRCGVHTNSGVQNYWFYLMVNGGAGVNDIADSFNVVAVGMNKAEKIAFRNLTVYLSPSSNYDEARFYAIQSAIDLYGACSPEVESTTNAWHAVGVGESYQNFVSASFTAIEDITFCYLPVTLNFLSDGSNVQNFIWDFGNGSTSTLRNPTVTYNTQGTFTVQLIGDGGTCGSDTVLKTNYIVVDTVNAPCSYTLNDTANQILTTCQGRLFDSGGFGDPYQSNESGTVTIFVSNADYIELDFITLDIEAGSGFNCNKDFIEVFDGSDLDAPLIGRYCSNFLPVGNKINSTSNAVTLRMISDAAANEAGFLINWECKTAISAPVADFSVNTDSTCSGRVAFRNKSSDGSSSVLWDFGDGSTSTEAHPIHSYYADGDYTVSLTVNNTVGSNTVTRTNLINVSKLALPSFVGDTVCIGERAGIKINTISKAEWYRDSTSSSIYSGDSLTLFNLRKDTAFYVKEVSVPPTFSGGPLNSIGAGGYSTDNDYIIFDIYKPILLQTMVLFSNKAAVRRLDIWNSSGELVTSKDVYVSSSPLRVNLNIELQPDSNYRMSFSDRDISLYKNTAGASYPYDISNLVSIKGSNNPGEYPYFYRWGVSELPCESNFKTVIAIVDSACTTVGVDDVNIEENQISFSPNPFNSQLKVTYKTNSKTSLQLNVRSIDGKLILNKSTLAVEGVEILNLAHLSKGVYVVTIIGDNFSHTEKLIKTN